MNKEESQSFWIYIIAREYLRGSFLLVIPTLIVSPNFTCVNLALHFMLILLLKKILSDFEKYREIFHGFSFYVCNNVMNWQNVWVLQYSEKGNFSRLVLVVKSDCWFTTIVTVFYSELIYIFLTFWMFWYIMLNLCSYIHDLV